MIKYNNICIIVYTWLGSKKLIKYSINGTIIILLIKTIDWTNMCDKTAIILI